MLLDQTAFQRCSARVLLLSESTYEYGRTVGSGVCVFALENDWEFLSRILSNTF